MSRLHLDGWRQYEWSLRNQNVTVLHSEPFRWSWFATKLVSYVFVIHDTPDSYESVLDDYVALRGFASDHKKTRIPFSLQAGFALLPIYVGAGFNSDLVSQIESKYRKRWCVMHIPSLYDTQTYTCHTLSGNYFWGCVYREFVSETIRSIAEQMRPPQKVA
jgi:GNAT superfamily N-acetyltransferase